MLHSLSAQFAHGNIIRKKQTLSQSNIRVGAEKFSAEHSFQNLTKHEHLFLLLYPFLVDPQRTFQHPLTDTAYLSCLFVFIKILNNILHEISHMGLYIVLISIRSSSLSLVCKSLKRE